MVVSYKKLWKLLIDNALHIKSLPHLLISCQTRLILSIFPEMLYPDPAQACLNF